MMTQDGWPDASEFPFIALVRIRYAHEFDLEVLSVVQRAMRRTLATGPAIELAKTITSVAARVAKAGMDNPVPLERSASLANVATAGSVMIDDCGTRPPWRWPPPPPWWRDLEPSPQPWAEVSSVAGVRAIALARGAVAALVDRAAAEVVDQALTATLEQLTG